MKFNKAKLFPLVIKLGDFLKEAFDQYAIIRGSGIEPDADMLAAFIQIQIQDWNPKLSGKYVLDDETREACARFVGGIAFNLAK
jgi:hypothetical protein